MAVKEEKTGTFSNMPVTLERQTDTKRANRATSRNIELRSEPSGILENVPVFSSFTAIYRVSGS